MWHLHALEVQVMLHKFQGLAALKWHTGHRRLLQVTDTDRLDNKYSLSIVLNVLWFGANTELLKSFHKRGYSASGNFIKCSSLTKGTCSRLSSRKFL
jgi:hypothetical protein